MPRFFANLFILLLLPCVTLAAGESVVRLATTTSTENSGLFTAIQPAIEQALDIRMHVIAVGTGKALVLGRRGDVDAVLVHAKSAEEAFVAAGYGLARHEIMYNDFLIVGPAQDPAAIRSLPGAAVALKKIAATSAAFVSRGDDSGTHHREQALWQQAGITPGGRWYRQVGQGMAEALQIAGELQAYTLVDRATWQVRRDKSPLVPLLAGGGELKNTYAVIAVNPQRYPEVNHPAVARLIDWFASNEAHELLSAWRVDGEPLFYPVVR